MVKHVILWTIKGEYQGEEKQKIIAGIKEGLESLAGKSHTFPIPTALPMQAIIKPILLLKLSLFDMSVSFLSSDHIT